MKLIKRSYQLAAISLIPLLVVGSILGFYTIKYIIYEETDEFLSYEMERLIDYHNQYNDLPDFHQVANIFEGEKLNAPYFRDTLMLEPADNELIPYRELHFPINHKGQDFVIVLRHLLPGNDDLFEGTLFIIVGFSLLMLLMLFFLINSFSSKIWKPFYRTLNSLNAYRLTGPLPEFEKSAIDEFEQLNAAVQQLLEKISSDYRRIKEFNGNASHELQTNLAVIRAQTEKLMNLMQAKEHSEPTMAIYNAALRLSQAQKSLLLLSKIGNLEYNNNTRLNLAEVIRQILPLFEETSAVRSISIQHKIEDCYLVMDAGLTEIMLSNLLKNAVKHNVEGGYITFELTKTHLWIENTGLPYQGNPENLLERFAKGESGNLGIGLSIVKQICDLYHFSLSYKIDKNTHKLHISFC